jgi:hypothetical protein
MNSEKSSSRFAKVYGSPGQGPRTIGPLRVFWPLMPICLAAGWLLHAALPVPHLSTSSAGVLFVLLAVTLALFIGWSARRLRSFLKGAEGEETVARILSFLPSNHTVFNDLQLDPGGPAFDHIVVAPAGIFVIETKNWSGEITFQNGQVLSNGHAPSRPPLKQVKEEAAALLDHLAGLAEKLEQLPPDAAPRTLARIRGLREAQGAFVRLKAPIPFDAPDGKPVAQVFILLVPEQATQQHLDILSELAQMLSDKSFRETLLTATDENAVHVALTTWEPIRPAA